MVASRELARSADSARSAMDVCSASTSLVNVCVWALNSARCSACGSSPATGVWSSREALELAGVVDMLDVACVGGGLKPVDGMSGGVGVD